MNYLDRRYRAMEEMSLPNLRTEGSVIPQVLKSYLCRRNLPRRREHPTHCHPWAHLQYPFPDNSHGTAAGL